MGSACSTNGSCKKFLQHFSGVEWILDKQGGKL